MKFLFVIIIRDSKKKNNTDGCVIFMSYDDMRYSPSETTRKILNFFQLLAIKNRGLAPVPFLQIPGYGSSLNQSGSTTMLKKSEEIQTWRLRREVHLHLLLSPPAVRLVLQEKPLGTQPLSHRIRRRRQFTKIRRRRQLASIAAAATADE